MEKLKTIILIDDDEICSWLNKLLLEEMQIAEQVECIYDGQAAYDFFERISTSMVEGAADCPELIFMDLDMPGLDGFQLLDKLKVLPGGEQFSRERIVILSTSMHPVDLERAIGYNVLNYLVKPLTETKVKSLINHYLKATQQDQPEQKDTYKTPPFQDRAPVEGSQAQNAEKKANWQRG